MDSDGIRDDGGDERGEWVRSLGKTVFSRLRFETGRLLNRRPSISKLVKRRNKFIKYA